jgi:hypothetical protein
MLCETAISFAVKIVLGSAYYGYLVMGKEGKGRSRRNWELTFFSVNRGLGTRSKGVSAHGAVVGAMAS